MKRFVTGCFAAIAVLAMSAGTASAVTIIDFGTGFGGPGGTINISGSNASGSGIFIDSLTITGAPSGNGVYDVEGTGACADGSGGCGVLSFNTATNTISLTGAIPSLGIGSQTLLWGDFSGGYTITANTGVVGSIFASGVDTKSAALLAAIGLDPNTPFAYFGFTMGFNLLGTGSPYTAISTDITNTSVPEPGSIALFGSGLLGLGAAVRRRFGKK
jgi:hypothetical protein